MLNHSLRCALVLGLLASAAVRADDEKIRTDLHGDALPDGALARLGSVRQRHGDYVTFAAFLPGGKTLVSAGADWTIRIWDVADGKELRRLTHADSIVMAWPHARASRQYLLHAALSADGKLLATGLNYGRSVALWDPAAGKELRTFNIPASGGINNLAVSPDGKTVAVGSTDSVVRLYASATGKEIRTLAEFDRQGRNRFALFSSAKMSYSPDGKQLVVFGMEIDNGNSKRALNVWDVAGGKVQYCIDADANHVDSASTSVFSPNSKMLAWATKSGDITLADSATGKVRKTIKSGIPRLGRIAFSPDGKSVLGCGIHDGVIGIWDTESGKELRMIGKAETPEVMRARITDTQYSIAALAVSPDGKKALCLDDNIVRLIDLVAAREELPCAGHRAHIVGMSFTHGGKKLVTQGCDNTIRV